VWLIVHSKPPSSSASSVPVRHQALEPGMMQPDELHAGGALLDTDDLPTRRCGDGLAADDGQARIALQDMHHRPVADGAAGQKDD
jgi:hypothetical protein